VEKKKNLPALFGGDDVMVRCSIFGACLMESKNYIQIISKIPKLNRNSLKR